MHINISTLILVIYFSNSKQNPVLWTVQRALHFTPWQTLHFTPWQTLHFTPWQTLHFTPWQTCSFQCHFDFSGKHSTTLQLLHKDYSFKYPPLLVPGNHLFSCINCGNKQNCQSFQMAARGFEPGFSRVRA